MPFRYRLSNLPMNRQLERKRFAVIASMHGDAYSLALHSAAPERFAQKLSQAALQTGTFNDGCFVETLSEHCGRCAEALATVHPMKDSTARTILSRLEKKII
jgi:hypothetical protein